VKSYAASFALLLVRDFDVLLLKLVRPISPNYFHSLHGKWGLGFGVWGLGFSAIALRMWLFVSKHLIVLFCKQ
jgi:hypothetical protein